MSIFTKKERLIIAKKAKDYADQISLNTAQLHIGKSCYIKGYTDAIEQANGENKEQNKALHLRGVMPRSSFIENQLHIKRDSRILNVRGFVNMNIPHVMLNVMENWQPMDEYEDEEHEDATFYLTSDDIDKLIDKLREGKAFLNGA